MNRLTVKGNHRLPPGDSGAVETYQKDLPKSAGRAPGSDRDKHAGVPPGAMYAQTKTARVTGGPISLPKSRVGLMATEGKDDRASAEPIQGNASIPGVMTLPGRAYNPDNMASITTDRGDFRWR